MPENDIIVAHGSPHGWTLRHSPLAIVVILSLWTVLMIGVTIQVGAAEDPFRWPTVTPTAKPRAYWWWMASAVDTNNLGKELARYQEAGLGGVHIIPIYGAKGWESNYLTYLSPKWMEMLDFTVKEAKRLGMEVDMTTGSGWCFGGPSVMDAEANATMVNQQWRVAGGERLTQKLEPGKTQALLAFGSAGRKVDLLGKVQADGSVIWTAPDGEWTVYAVSQKPSGQKVKRAAPGGAGHMLNLFYAPGVSNYLRWVDAAFAHYKGAKPRAQYHDSYEYRSDWAPDFFTQFEKRRGYRLQDEWETFITGKPSERAARVKCDYRETLAQIMSEQTLPMWNQWAHGRGFITRNEAHGSPGNWLDLYAAADIPETEMFYKDRNQLIAKFASSAAHVMGKPLVGSETGTWLKEHFQETLEDMKLLLDDLFLSGVNHVFYHGTCYSPDEAAWPGWLFYASYEMNPRNSVWRDVAALNAYATRCQSVLQAGQPDNDVLLYWPIHDLWSEPEGLARNLTVHARDWFEAKPFGATAEKLWKAGYQFDYISDRQLAETKTTKKGIRLKGATYSTIVVPPCDRMPLETMAKLIQFARSGSISVVFADKLPEDVPGLGHLESRRRGFTALVNELSFWEGPDRVRTAKLGKKSGELVVGPLEAALSHARAQREPLFDLPALMCIRRRLADGRYYFLANRGDVPIEAWIPLATSAQSACVMDPMTGNIHALAVRSGAGIYTEVPLSLPPGGSVILRTFTSRKSPGSVPPPPSRVSQGAALSGVWHVRFVNGGPVLPAPFETARLGSWTESSDTNAQSFAGTACYQLRFDEPTDAEFGVPHPDGVGRKPSKGGTLNRNPNYVLNLGRVFQSARVRLNGEDLGTLFTSPFSVPVRKLRPKDNLLEVEVTNTSANRIRDLDRRGANWRNFHDINFVNLDYKPFNAADWPLANSGLLGPVTLTPLRANALNVDK